MGSCNEQSLGRLIYHTAKDMRTMAEKILYPYDLTVEQMHLLKNLETDVGTSQKTLGAKVGKTAANMTRILERLESKALVERREGVSDKRVSSVFLTAKGVALIIEVHETFQRFSDQMLKGISIEMQETTRLCLTTMAQNLKKIPIDFPEGAVLQSEDDL
jgi:DNA-binding MarR family transcriptional regulator